MITQELKVQVNETDSISAVLYPADNKTRVGTTIILGHGAGAGQHTPFMRLFANGLAERGFDVLTFDFVYMEQRKKVPDRNDKLELCYRAVIDAAAKHKKLKGNRLVIGGKSMGGRIASQVAAYLANNPNAEDSLGGIASTWLRPTLSGLIFLGYPLHPPGRPDKMRDAHLPDVKAPMLFIQGSRDAFGSEDEIRDLFKRLKLNATLHAIAGGDHSLKAPKSAGLTQEQVYEGAMNSIMDWTNTIRP
ncbi:MAG TPA: alpha/beta fold hydrolase [Pyrinomonadaceae bacterium]|nr:alpha/beta fold hydrolase [Pyrinomonadaceae bacterium]